MDIAAFAARPNRCRSVRLSKSDTATVVGDGIE